MAALSCDHRMGVGLESARMEEAINSNYFKEGQTTIIRPRAAEQ